MSSSELPVSKVSRNTELARQRTALWHFRPPFSTRSMVVPASSKWSSTFAWSRGRRMISHSSLRCSSLPHETSRMTLLWNLAVGAKTSRKLQSRRRDGGQLVQRHVAMQRSGKAETVKRGLCRCAMQFADSAAQSSHALSDMFVHAHLNVRCVWRTRAATSTDLCGQSCTAIM